MTQTSAKPKIDIVLPCYNPSDEWYLGLVDFYEQTKNEYGITFVIVNDGSNSHEFSKKLDDLKQNHMDIVFISYTKNMGKGYALRQGVNCAQNRFIVYTDIDFPFTNASTIELIKELLIGKYDIVAGYRDQSYYLKSMTFYRKMLSRAFRYFIKNIMRMPITDTQCGLKGFNEKGKTKFLETTINRYLFDFEFIYTSVNDPSINVGAVQVQLKEGITFRKMRLKILLQETFNLLYVLFFKKLR